MKEDFDILNEKGEKTGRWKERSLVSQQNVWWGSAHVWLINSNRQLLIQKRSLLRPNSPGCWDISAAGHVLAGEEAVMAAGRELEEELGIKVTTDQLEFFLYLKNKKRRCFHSIFLLKMDYSLERMILQAEEVEAVRWITGQEIKKEIVNSPERFVERELEYPKLFEYLDSIA